MANLGGLETRIMDVLWNAHSPLSVREVHDALTPSTVLAYTTILTVLDRLAKKGLAARTREGKAWSYTPSSSREELLISELHAALGHPDVDRLAVLTAVAGRLTEAEQSHLIGMLGRQDP